MTMTQAEYQENVGEIATIAVSEEKWIGADGAQRNLLASMAELARQGGVKFVKGEAVKPNHIGEDSLSREIDWSECLGTVDGIPYMRGGRWLVPVKWTNTPYGSMPSDYPAADLVSVDNLPKPQVDWYF